MLLLPLSIIANEALLIFPNSYYLQWINSSLISGALDDTSYEHIATGLVSQFVSLSLFYITAGAVLQ